MHTLPSASKDWPKYMHTILTFDFRLQECMVTLTFVYTCLTRWPDHPGTTVDTCVEEICIRCAINCYSMIVLCIYNNTCIYRLEFHGGDGFYVSYTKFRCCGSESMPCLQILAGAQYTPCISLVPRIPYSRASSHGIAVRLGRSECSHTPHQLVQWWR